jgi:hypothetical protein
MLMNMGVINLIVCAHDARDAAHRLTAVSGGRRRAKIRSGDARDQRGKGRRSPSPGMNPVDLDDRLGRRAQ